MAGIKSRLVGEVSHLFKQMIAFSESKRELKQRALAEGKPFFYYYRGKIFSHKTFQNYYKEAKEFVTWCNQNCGITSTYRITPEMMVACINTHKELSNNTIKTKLAAISKLAEGIELKINKDKATRFHLASKQIQSKLPKFVPNRPVYSAQQISSLEQKLNQTNSHYGLVFKVHVETGCRLRELSKLTRKDLLGLINNQKEGLLSIRGKGGRVRELVVSSETYMKVANYLDRREILCSYNGYRQALRRASENLSLGVAATHAVRRFAAQKLMSEKLQEYKEQSITDSQAREMALGDVNAMLGHSVDRMSTTNIYLNA